MAELRCNIRDLAVVNDVLSAEQVAGARFAVIGHPQRIHTDSHVIAAGSGFPAAHGNLDAGGNVTVDIRHLGVDGQYYTFHLTDHPDMWWPFLFRSGDDPAFGLGERIGLFYEEHPDGDPTVTHVPTPGDRGPRGYAGASPVDVYAVSPDQPDTPTGGTVDVASVSVISLPDGGDGVRWARNPPDVPDGSKLWLARTWVNPALQAGHVVNPVWLAPAEAGGTGPSGPVGSRGWSAQVSPYIVGEEIVQQLRWVGGEGQPPPGDGMFLLGNMLTADAADATNIRGGVGPDGDPGPPGPGTPVYTGAGDPNTLTVPALVLAAVGSIYLRVRSLHIEVWEKTTLDDPLRNWVQQSEHSLAAGQLIPPGGVLGQVVGKTGPADYERGWVDAGDPGEGGVDQTARNAASRAQTTADNATARAAANEGGIASNDADITAVESVVGQLQGRRVPEPWASVGGGRMPATRWPHPNNVPALGAPHTADLTLIWDEGEAAWQRIAVSTLISSLLGGIVTQADAMAGTSNHVRLWTPRRVAQAIAALAGDSDPFNLTNDVENEALTLPDGRRLLIGTDHFGNRNEWVPIEILAQDFADRVVNETAHVDDISRWAEDKLPRDTVFAPGSVLPALDGSNLTGLPTAPANASNVVVPVWASGESSVVLRAVGVIPNVAGDDADQFVVVPHYMSADLDSFTINPDEAFDATAQFQSVVRAVQNPGAGVEVEVHTTQASYDAAPDDDDKLHVLAIGS